MNPQGIIHVFNGDLSFHVIRKSEYIIRFSSHPIFLLIYLTKEDLREKYIALFTKYGCTDYYITKPVSHRLSLLCNFLLAFKKDQLSPCQNDLVFHLSKFRTNRILFHGYFFSQLIVALIAIKYFKNVNWICWGTMLRKNSARRLNLRDALNNWLTETAYKRFNSVICLLKSDQNELESSFSLKHVFLAPYGCDFNDLYKDNPELVSRRKTNDPPRILVGNSAHVIDDYIDFVRGLDGFPANVSLTFMMNYGMVSHAEKVECLKKLLSEKSLTYDFWDKTEPFNVYLEKIAQFDVYVCPAQYQSGLGAIYHMLYLGKTVYLKGYNLQWVIQCGFFSVKDIGQFLSDVEKGHGFPLDSDLIARDRDLLTSLTNPAQAIKRHDEIVCRKD